MADDVPAESLPDSSANRDENSDGRVKAGLNPSSTANLSTILRADYIPAILEWDSGENENSSGSNNNSGHHHHVGESANNPAALLLSYDSSSKTLVFRLRIIVALRGSSSDSCNAKEPLYLCIQPASLHRLAHHTTEQPPAQYIGRLGNKLRSLRVELLSAAGLTVPDRPLAPQSQIHGRVLDAAKRLALQRTFTVYIQQSPTLPPASLDMLCASVARRELQTSPASGDLRTLFDGRLHTRFRVIGRDEIVGAPAPAPKHVQTLSGVPATGHGQDDTGPPPSPPSYNTIDPPPPMAPLDRHAPKRKRRSSSGDAGTGSSAAGADVDLKLGISLEKICRKLIADELSHTQQRIDRLERERDDAVRLVEKLRQELRNAVDRLDERLDDKIEDRVWLEVDELRTSLHMDMDELQGDLESEMREYVEEQVGEQIGEHADRVAEEIHTRLASAQVNILEGRLEIQYQNG